MKAIVQIGDGFRLADVEQPIPGPGQVLVRVHACALNRADLGMLAGRLHGQQGGAGTVLGLEWSGEVVRVGADVPRFKPGDRVMCSGKGGFAEYAVTDWSRVLHLPQPQLDFRQAACLPVALQTMHDALVTHGALRPGAVVVIQGASSGVGLMGLQIAKLLGAGLVIGTSTTPAKREKLSEYGADVALDTSGDSWVDQVLNLTAGKGADIIVDQLAGRYANLNMHATAICGRIVNVGRLAGVEHSFDFNLHALRRISYIGVTFRTRSDDEVREINRRMVADLWPALSRGLLKQPIDRCYDIDEAAAAFERMKANSHFGKIVLHFPRA